MRQGGRPLGVMMGLNEWGHPSSEVAFADDASAVIKNADEIEFVKTFMMLVSLRCWDRLIRSWTAA